MKDKEKNKERKSTSDIGLLDDVIELIKNVCSMEAHAQASYMATRDERWLRVKDDVRKIRTKWLDIITKKNFGQVWCWNKHACESMMRLDEIQSRFLSTAQKKEAIVCSKHYETIMKWLLILNDIMSQDISGEPSTSP